jgi:hypothetical protein
MKVFLMVALFCGIAFAQQEPDPAKTPGKVDPNCSMKDICPHLSDAWNVRHVDESMKKEVCKEYGITEGCPGPKWELDHFIDRSICGADSTWNLWPQPLAEAKIKDHKVEDVLHKQVCAGKMTLTAAQACMKSGWVACGKKLGTIK